MNPSESSLRLMRLVHGALLVSMFFYAVLGEKLGPAEARELKIFPQAFAL